MLDVERASGRQFDQQLMDLAHNLRPLFGSDRTRDLLDQGINGRGHPLRSVRRKLLILAAPLPEQHRHGQRNPHQQEREHNHKATARPTRC